MHGSNRRHHGLDRQGYRVRVEHGDAAVPLVGHAHHPEVDHAHDLRPVSLAVFPVAHRARHRQAAALLAERAPADSSAGLAETTGDDAPAGITVAETIAAASAAAAARVAARSASKHVSCP